MVTDLVIVGAGPCGLVSALLAKQARLSCVVLERRAEGQFFGHAHYLNQYSLRILAMAGVDVDSLAEKATPVDSALQMAYCTTFSQILSRVSCFDDPLFRQVWDHADRHGTCLNVRFEDLMGAILAACHRLQVPIVWECTFNSLDQMCKHTSLDGLSSSSLYKVVAYQLHQVRFFYAGWVLACDGARGSVSSSLGVERKDQNIWQNFLSVELLADFSSFLLTPPMLLWIYHPKLQACMVVHDVSNYQVLQIPVGPEVVEKDLCRDRLRQAVYSLCGLSLSEPLKLSFGKVKSWSMQTFLLSSLVHDRVVFLGDSAHAMTPAGGLGLNTALADASNLIWKIAHADQTPSSYWMFSYEAERKDIARQNVQASIDNYLDFLSVPHCFGYDLLGSCAQHMLNAYILPSRYKKLSASTGDSWWAAYLSQMGGVGQSILSNNRFFREYLSQATFSHLKHFRGLDQHLGFCYRTELIDKPHSRLGDYTLDYDVVRQGGMMPSVQVRLYDCDAVMFVHELVMYPKWCLLYQVKEDWSSFLPDCFSDLVDCFFCGEDYVWLHDSPLLPDADILLIRPDGIVAFVGDSQAFQSYLAKLSACVGAHGGDGDGAPNC